MSPAKIKSKSKTQKNQATLPIVATALWLLGALAPAQVATRHPRISALAQQTFSYWQN